MYILPLDSTFEELHAGAKGFHLSRMKRAGFPVPDGFVLSKQAFEDFFCGGKSLSDELKKELMSTLGQYASAGFMVRSSAIGEDSSDASFAGQLESFITGNEADAVIQNVYSCWQSYRKESVQAYERSTGKKLNGMAVVVQKLVSPDYAGVIFTRSHLDGSKMLVEYVRGHGENLVSGKVNPDGFQCSADTDLDSLNLPFKFKTAYDTALRLEQFYGCALDIEWVIKGEEFFVVQARPITTPVKGDRIYWSNTNVNENYPGPITPLLYSVARDSYYHYFKNLSHLFLVPDERIRGLESSFSNIIGAFGCRMYYNMSSIHRIISESPFAALLSGAFNDFVGYAEESRSKVQKASLRQKITFMLRFVKLSRKLNRNVNEFELIADKFRNMAGSAITPGELRESFHGFIAIRMHSWYRASLADFFAMAYHGMLGKFCTKYYSEGSSGVHNGLIQAIPGIVSSQPVSHMYKILKTLRNDDDLYAVFQKEKAGDFYKRLVNSGSPVNQLVENYLRDWGFRCSGELMLTITNYCENPADFILLLKQYDAMPDTDPDQLIAQRHIEKKKIFNNFVSRIWKKNALNFPVAIFHRIILWFLVSRASSAICARERVRLKQAMIYFNFRKTLLRLGRELKLRNTIENEDDIFYLRCQEISELLTSSDIIPASLKSQIRLRKTEFIAASASIYPDDFYSESGKEPLPGDVQGQKQNAVSTKNGINGLSACGGKVRGRARVLESVLDAGKLQKGDILVTRQTDPGWVVIFPLISGLIVERGGMLSHGAIVSREFGIPAIVGVEGATAKIKDNDLLYLDADNGEITIHAE